jgi:Protein of unknown function (DUF3147)
MVTVVAGVIAKNFGPGIGGLFLAFSAIFPASATLIEKHESQKKEKEGFEGTQRGRQAASVDASGAAMGSIGLLVFAFLVWKFIARYSPWLVLVSAALIWLIVSVLLWQIRKRS